MKWEYKIIEVGKSKGFLFQTKDLSVDPLNELGKEGWELVSSFSVSGSAAGFGTKHQPDQVFLILKRPAS